MRRGWAAGLLAVALFAATPVAAEPVKVRMKEGNSRGFLALRPPGGDGAWPTGELGQKPAGRLVPRAGSSSTSRTARSTARR